MRMLLSPRRLLGVLLLLGPVRTGEGAAVAQALTGACAAANPDDLLQLDGGQCLFASDFFQQCVVYLRAKNTTCNDWCNSQGSTATTAGWQCAGGWTQYASGQQNAMPQRRLDGVALQDECLGGCDLGCDTPSQSEYMVCRCKETSTVDAVQKLADDALYQLLATSPGVPGASISTESDVAIVKVTIMTADHADSTGGRSIVTIPDSPVTVQVPASAIRKYGGTVALVLAAFKEEPSGTSAQSVVDSNGSAISHLGAPVSVQFATSADGYLSVDGLEDPIRITVTRPTELDNAVGWDCGYFLEDTGLWTTEKVELEETASGHLVCTTQHLTFFAAVGRSFIDVLRCSNAYLLDAQAVRQIGKGSWAYEPAAVFLWTVCILHVLLCAGAIRFDLRAHEEGLWVDEHFLRERPPADALPEAMKAKRGSKSKILTRRLTVQVKEKLQEKRKELPGRGEFKTWLRAQVNAYCIKQIVAYHMWISPRDMRSLLDWLEEEEDKERSTITDAVSRETTEQVPGSLLDMPVRAQGSKETETSTRPPSRHGSKDPSVLGGSKQASTVGQTPTPSQRSVWGQSVSSQREMMQSGIEPGGLQFRADEAAGRSPQVYEEMPQSVPRTGEAPASSFVDMWWDYFWGSGKLTGRCFQEREVARAPNMQKVQARSIEAMPEEVPMEDCLTPMSSHELEREEDAAAPVLVAEEQEPDIPEQRQSKTSRATPTTPIPDEMSVNLLARLMTRKRLPRNQPEDNNVQGEMQTWRTMDTNNSQHSRSGSKEPVLKTFAKPLKEQLEKNHEQYFAERSSRRYATGMLCFGLQPWLSLYRYSIFDSSTARALHLTAEVFGALLFAALFFGIDAPSVESPADCDGGSWSEDLWGEVLAAFFGFWFALIPRLILGLLGKRSFKDLPDQDAIDSQLRSWLIQDIVKWVFGICYILCSLVYILIFLSNTKIDSGFSWVAASLIEELLLNLFVPVSIAMAYLLLEMTSVRSEEDYAKARERLGLRQMQQLQEIHRSFKLQSMSTHISV